MLELGKASVIEGGSMFNRILRLMKMHDKVKVIHYYREANTCAEALAKVGVEPVVSLEFRVYFLGFIREFFVLNGPGSSAPRLVSL